MHSLPGPLSVASHDRMLPCEQGEAQSGRPGMQQGGDDRGGIETALLGGALDRGKHLLGRRAAARCGSPADFADDDGRPNRVLSAPVGGIDGGITEEG